MAGAGTGDESTDDLAPEAELSNSARPASAAPPPAGGSMSSRSIALAAMLFVMGLTIGALGALVFSDDDGGSADPASEAVGEVPCDDATAIVDAALAEIENINQSEVQNASFFAALLVEQREITFAMDAAPECFTLEDRAGAQGLLEGIEGLLLASEPLVAPAPASAPADE